MKIRFVESISAVPPEQWQRLQGTDNPFVDYRFLHALEQSGSVGGESGWQPHHLIISHDAGQLLGAVPSYLKQHSYGEYVFDWGWADAYRRAGLAYYPKLVCAVPFTPATGSRLLTVEQDEPQAGELRHQLAMELIEEARRRQLSSIHCLFLPRTEAELLTGGQGEWLARHDLQFHWQNQNYQQFGDFLATFSSKKRKNVNRERRRVREAGVEMELLEGSELSADHWRLFYQLYRLTAYKRGGTAYLTEQFFKLIADQMADRVVMVLAKKGGEYVAAALNFRGSDALYGRSWGCLANFDSLHFETCYYRAIEYCIEKKIARYEAGAQGEHKLSRGFLPTTTHSLHWLAHPQFADAVADYLDQEREQISGYQQVLQAHTPFRRG